MQAEKESSGNKEVEGKEVASDRGSVSAPAITLPKGGGAIRGIGEKFAANPVTGTGSMTVPIAMSPGRSGFGPQLSLSYDSGSGNGTFGFGWSLSLPQITRKTDKGLPKYLDAEGSDVFILSGAEDLVPVLKQDANGKWLPDTVSPRTIGGKTYNIRRYRPRIEGLFARIERWTNSADAADVFWRSVSKDNITTWYGKDEDSRIFEPSTKGHIFSWHICESYDDKGNAIFYEYKEEDSTDIDSSQANERNRTDQSRSSNRYLKRIKYGNSTPRQDAEDLSQRTDWLFEVVFDYGDHDQNNPLPVVSGKWPRRNDPFSSYRSGFEVRTYRLCQRVLMFHHIPDLPTGEKGYDGLVRSTDFNYSYEENQSDAQNPIFSFLLSVTQWGYKRQGNAYLKKSLPPLEFTYSPVEIDETVNSVDPESLENLPVGLDGSIYQWVDLDGEGISGILTEQGGAWYYKRNTSADNIIKDGGTERTEPRFEPVQVVALKPNATLSAGAQLLDLAGDGQLDLAEFDGPVPGFYERTHDADWAPFAVFSSLPNIAWKDPNLKFVDLSGDGHADVLITENEVFTWHPSLAEEGFGPAEKVYQAWDEEKGPRLVFADGTQSIYLADISGDGLTDIVRIRNGEVSYWPNLGYGKFGAKVTMDNSPWFDNPDLFDQRRIRLADIDGSGVTDIIYLGNDGVRLYFNQSGNSWSKARILGSFPHVDNLSSVLALDLLGNGTACLVWSSPLPGNARQPMHYIRLMKEKPHLLTKTVNNLGAETEVHYAPSTRFYLDDMKNGKPWITRIPFPVHAVERVITYDHISRNRFVTRYEYHHGYFDGIEREFRGFGMVEQWDTESFASFEADGLLEDADNIDKASHVPPVLTKTWFHTGAYLERQRIEEYFREHEYYDGDADCVFLDDTVIPSNLSIEEEREACRALKGSMLRQEVYALDGSGKEKNPYTVTEQNFSIRTLQPRSNNRHAVFFAHHREAINYHYERNPDDPRINHALTLKVDDYGNVERSVAIGYPRRAVSGRKPEQAKTHITFTVNRFANQPDEDDWHRIGLPVETRTFEIVKPPEPTGMFSFETIRALTEDLFKLNQNGPEAAKTLPYEKWDWRKDASLSNDKKLRLIEHVRTLYRENDLTGPLPLGVAKSLALPFESYKLAFTPELAEKVFVDSGKVSSSDLNTILTDEGKYIHSESDTNWWIPSGRIFYSQNTTVNAATELAYARQHFFLPHRYRDPFHATNSFNTETIVTYDSYDLLLRETQDALDNRVTVGERKTDGTIDSSKPGNDYRVLQPRLVMDPNRNRTEVIFDALGLVAGTAMMGKPEDNPQKGDFLDASFQANLSDADIGAFYDAVDPHALAENHLKTATTRIVYDMDHFHKTRQAFPGEPEKWEPVFAATLARETHVSDLKTGEKTKIQISFSNSDGFGREIQKKIQAEPEASGSPLRWVGSGWTIFNNKGKPVRQYEPFFSKLLNNSHQFEFGVQEGVSPVLFYDPVERVVATLHPNHTYEKVVFDPWQQTT